MKILRYFVITFLSLTALNCVAAPTKALVDSVLPTYFDAQEALADDDLKAAQADGEKLLAIAATESAFVSFTESLESMLATDDLEKGAPSSSSSAIS